MAIPSQSISSKPHTQLLPCVVEGIGVNELTLTCPLHPSIQPGKILHFPQAATCYAVVISTQLLHLKEQLPTQLVTTRVLWGQPHYTLNTFSVLTDESLLTHLQHLQAIDTPVPFVYDLGKGSTWTFDRKRLGTLTTIETTAHTVSKETTLSILHQLVKALLPTKLNGYRLVVIDPTGELSPRDPKTDPPRFSFTAPVALNNGMPTTKSDWLRLTQPATVLKAGLNCKLSIQQLGIHRFLGRMVEDFPAPLKSEALRLLASRFPVTPDFIPYTHFLKPMAYSNVSARASLLARLYEGYEQTMFAQEPDEIWSIQSVLKSENALVILDLAHLKPFWRSWFYESVCRELMDYPDENIVTVWLYPDLHLAGLAEHITKIRGSRLSTIVIPADTRSEDGKAFAPLSDNHWVINAGQLPAGLPLTPENQSVLNPWSLKAMGLTSLGFPLSLGLEEAPQPLEPPAPSITESGVSSTYETAYQAPVEETQFRPYPASEGIIPFVAPSPQVISEPEPLPHITQQPQQYPPEQPMATSSTSPQPSIQLPSPVPPSNRTPSTIFGDHAPPSRPTATVIEQETHSIASMLFNDAPVALPVSMAASTEQTSAKQAPAGHIPDSPATYSPAPGSQTNAAENSFDLPHELLSTQNNLPHGEGGKTPHPETVPNVHFNFSIPQSLDQPYSAPMGLSTPTQPEPFFSKPAESAAHETASIHTNLALDLNMDFSTAFSDTSPTHNQPLPNGIDQLIPSSIRPPYDANFGQPSVVAPDFPTGSTPQASFAKQEGPMTPSSLAMKEKGTENTTENNPEASASSAFNPHAVDQFQEGDRVKHEKYGVGLVQKAIYMGERTVLNVIFEGSGKRLLDPSLSKLEKVS